MTTQDLALELLPQVKKLLVNSEVEIKNNIENWFVKKGFFVRLFVKTTIGGFWALIIGPLLPVIIKAVIDIIIGTASPILIPFIPMINQFMDFIQEHILDPKHRERFKNILQLVQDFKPDTKLMESLNMEQSEIAQIMTTQEYF